jgi:ribosomal protein S18 acetylase RimI-like enzyme
MNAFDSAWDLVKMPIVPGSIKRRTYTPKRAESKHRDAWNYSWIGGGSFGKPDEQYKAKFRDPVTDEILDMQLNMELNQNERAVAQIVGPEFYQMTDDEKYDDPSNMRGTRASAWAGISWDNRDDDSGNYQVNNLDTKEEYRRRGYGTALYDLMAHALKNRRDGFSLIPDREQTRAARKLWDGRDKWPVRDDL